jgi:hypothetical protein
MPRSPHPAMRRINAMRIHAAAPVMVASKFLKRQRQRVSYAGMRATPSPGDGNSNALALSPRRRTDRAARN